EPAARRPTPLPAGAALAAAPSAQGPQHRRASAPPEPAAQGARLPL
ncbi:MAG: hypothetical protein AVDCRST_MAG45-214, partial [uncultured Solirubrobacterales bacterium]